MADRHRSTDGTRETDQYLDDSPATPSQAGRKGGSLERKVGSRAEETTAKHGDGIERVTKADEKGESGLGGHHGTGGEK